MEEMILLGYQASQSRDRKERADPNSLFAECNMQAPKSSKRQQQVFVVNSVDQRCLSILFNAFQLNTQMLKEMNLKQFFTKIVPYMHSKHNNYLEETDSSLASDSGESEERDKQAGGKPQAKYWFMNLAYRWTEQVEQLECAKVIYDMQDSMMFIFCSTAYSARFEEEMAQKWQFKKVDDLALAATERGAGGAASRGPDGSEQDLYSSYSSAPSHEQSQHDGDSGEGEQQLGLGYGRQYTRGKPSKANDPARLERQDAFGCKNVFTQLINAELNSLEPLVDGFLRESHALLDLTRD